MCSQLKRYRALVPLLILALTKVGADSRTGRGRGKWVLRYAAPGLLVLLAPALLWAGFGTTFKGVVTTLSTGGITLSNPADVAVDSLGNVYIADTINNQIVEVTAGGVASVLGFPNLTPALNLPTGLAVDGSGNLYIGDRGNNRIVEVAGGVASAVATGGVTLNGPQGVVADASGNLYIADTGNNRIVEVPAGGGAAVLVISGLSTALSGPAGLAVDGLGNLYVADGTNNRIVKVTPGRVGSVLSITGGLSLLTPLGVAVDGLGNVYVADANHNRIVTVTPGGVGGVLSTGSVTLNFPEGVAVGALGAVYIADSSSHLIVEAQRPAVGFGHLPSGALSGTTLTLPFSVSFSNTLGSVQAFTLGTPNLDFTVVSAGTTCVPGTTFALSCSVNIQFLPTAPGLRRGAVVLFDNSTPPIPLLTVPLYGTGDAPLAALSPGVASVIGTGIAATNDPFQIALDGAGNMYVANYGGNNVVKVPAGGGSASLVNTGGLTLNGAAGVALDGAGNLYISDNANSRIVKVTAAGVASAAVSLTFGTPVNLALDGAGNLYIADLNNNRVVKVTPAGAQSVLATGSIALGGGITGVAVDASGTVYIADRINNHVVKVTAAGAASLVIPAGITPALNFPQGVAVDGMGNLYISDDGNSRIVEVTTAGIASVVLTPGLANPATIGGFFGVVVDGSGNVFIPDGNRNRLVKVNVTGASLAFPNTNVGSASSPQTATVTNIGDLPLAFALSPTYTADFSQPTGATGQCLISTSLLAGTVCDMSVEFTPQSVGLLSANVVLTDNNLNLTNATQSVAVSGTGLLSRDTTATAVSSNPTSVILGQAITITAIVTDTTAGHAATVPTGGVTFTDTVGSTAVSLNGGNPAALSGAGQAILAGVMLSGPGLHTISVNYVGVVNSFFASSNTTTILVTVPTTTTTMMASVNPAISGQPVTFTATVSPAPTGSPLGMVSFFNGTTLLGSGNVNSSGIATFSATTLPSGANTITAVYSGNPGFGTSTSSALTETVTPAYNVTAPSTTFTVAQGGSVNVNVNVPPLGGAFKNVVTMSASGLPAGATATFNPPTVTPGAAGAPTVLTIQFLSVTTASLPAHQQPRPPFAPISAAVALCCIAFGYRRSTRVIFRRALVIVSFFLVGAFLSACNGGFASRPGTLPGSYTVTITGTSGSLHPSTTITLTVQ